MPLDVVSRFLERLAGHEHRAVAVAQSHPAVRSHRVGPLDVLIFNGIGRCDQQDFERLDAVRAPRNHAQSVDEENIRRRHGVGRMRDAVDFRRHGSSTSRPRPRARPRHHARIDHLAVRVHAGLIIGLADVALLSILVAGVHHGVARSIALPRVQASAGQHAGSRHEPHGRDRTHTQSNHDSLLDGQKTTPPVRSRSIHPEWSATNSPRPTQPAAFAKGPPHAGAKRILFSRQRPRLITTAARRCKSEFQEMCSGVARRVTASLEP